MSAVGLFHEDGKSAGIWYCSECRVVHRTEPEAIACHGQLLCKECGKEVSRYKRHIGLCDDCDSKAWRERMTRQEVARFEKADKIPEEKWDGPVFAEGVGQDWFTHMEEMREYIDEADEAKLPGYVWASKDVGVPRATPDSLIDNLLENMWEDADVSDLEGVEELDEAISAFNKANEGITVWNVDYSKAILLKPRPDAACVNSAGSVE